MILNKISQKLQTPDLTKQNYLNFMTSMTVQFFKTCTVAVNEEECLNVQHLDSFSNQFKAKSTSIMEKNIDITSIY